MNNYLLIKLYFNYADEFDVESFWVTTQEVYNAFLKDLENYDLSENDELYFGTNEFISFESVEFLLNSLEITPITEEFFNQLLYNFGDDYGL
jgi:hypothetical protein